MWEYRKIYHRLVLSGVPPVLCNSFQKSGTHLLVGAVGSLPQFHHYGRKAYWHYLTRARVDCNKISEDSKVIARLSQCLNGEIFRGHIAANKELIGFFARHPIKHIFIYRDLRDVIISMYFGWERNQGVVDSWPFRYFKSLKSEEQKISFLIEGWPDCHSSCDFPFEIDYPNIGERFSENLPWLSNEDCLAIKFEDLAPIDKRPKLLETVARYLLGERLTSKECMRMVLAMEQGCNPASSKTFRKGVSGEWQRYFTKEQKRTFKDVAGQYLIDLGYERDFDW